MFKSECCKELDCSIIPIEDGGVKIYFNNQVRDKYLKVRIDGCEITHYNRTDFLLKKQSTGKQLIIELKSSNATNCIEQFVNTYNHIKSKDPNYHQNTELLLVFNVYPSFSLNKIEREIRQKIKTKKSLHIKGNNKTVTFDEFFK